MPKSWQLAPKKQAKDGLEKRQVPGTKHTLIAHPNLEGWVLDICQKQSVRPEEFGLPSEVKKLAREFKDDSVESNQRVHKLFDKLVGRKAPGLMTLKTWLDELIRE